MSDWMIDPVALDLGFIQIHWYGLMYVFGFLGGYGFAIYRIDRGLFPINREQMSDFLSWIALGVIIGGRAGYMVFYQPDRLLDNPLSLFYVWEGGMAFHGGLVGVIVLTWIFARKHQIAPLALGDALAPLIPIGLGFGRLGNFIGGELWGRPTDLPWAMVFSKADELARHPSQLYQFALEGILLFRGVMAILVQAAETRTSDGSFLVGLWRISFYCGVCPRAGLTSWIYCTELDDDGSIADSSHDRDRCVAIVHMEGVAGCAHILIYSNCYWMEVPRRATGLVQGL